MRHGLSGRRVFQTDYHRLCLDFNIKSGQRSSRKKWGLNYASREDLSSKSVEPSRQRDNHEGIEVTRSLVNQ